MAEDKSVLLVEINKESKIDGRKFARFDHVLGETREGLEQYLKNRYEVVLPYEEKNEFPWFSDGGFKYETENEYWIFTFLATPRNVLK